MRIIPKKIKVKNTVWKSYSMKDIIVALIVFSIIFISITAGNWVFAAILGLVAVVMFMPTQDVIFYSCIFENVRFMFAKKSYTKTASKEKENIDSLFGLKSIKGNGLILYKNGFYGRVIKIGQKNFAIEDVMQQNIDIEYFANALKLLDGNTDVPDIAKIRQEIDVTDFELAFSDDLLTMQILAGATMNGDTYSLIVFYWSDSEQFEYDAELVE